MFVSHRSDGGPWPRYYTHAETPAKFVITEIGGVPTPDLGALLKIACGIEGGGKGGHGGNATGAPPVPRPPVRTSLVARDLRADDYPSGQTWEVTLRPGLGGVQLFEWDAAALAWVEAADACAGVARGLRGRRVG